MLIEASKLAKSFGKEQLFKDLSFSLDHNQVLKITGPSGVGKSTLIRCLCNLETISSGTLTINGTIGLVFQDFQLFPHMSVYENLVLAASYHHLANIEQKAAKLLEELELSEKKDFRISHLSGGQKQRVAIARALMLEPDILCFDEPTSALDRKTAMQVTKIIKKLKNEGLGIIVVSHDLAFIDQLEGDTLNLSY